MIKRSGLTRSLALLGLGILSACSGNERSAAADNADKRPNIIVILADDLGYSDLGSYGGEIQTPHLDEMAMNGVRFTRFYNTSRCCPTRASLLTGVYNQQAGIGEMTTDMNLPGYRGHITDNVVTLAEVLKNAGYRTAMTGKWHVSTTVVQPDKEAQLKWLNHQAEHPFFSPVEQYPVNRGFEKYYGNIFGVVNFFDPFSLVNGTDAVKSVPGGYYHTDALNDTAAAYVREFSKGDQPFFLYLAHTAPHWPLQALPEDISKYEDTYKVGWDAIRDARYKRMIELGLIDQRTTALSPRMNNELSWEANPDKEWDARAMAVHAAMVDRMDQGIGRLIATLKETGELENTLIVFLSDNGASPESSMRYGPGFDRPSETRDGRKIHFPLDKKVLPGADTSFASIGERWANVCNTPYQYAKAQSYEGGVRTPVIAYWPAGIKTKGAITQQLGHVMDFMPTFIELAGAEYPAAFKGKPVLPMTGISLVQALKGTETAKDRALYNEHFGARYVREGAWKMVSLSDDSTWHLYKIQEDEAELKDVAGKHPDVVNRLAAQWQNWARTHQVFPKPGKN